MVCILTALDIIVLTDFLLYKAFSSIHSYSQIIDDAVFNQVHLVSRIHFIKSMYAIVDFFENVWKAFAPHNWETTQKNLLTKA